MDGEKHKGRCLPNKKPKGEWRGGGRSHSSPAISFGTTEPKPWWRQWSHKVILIKRDSCRVITFPSCHPLSMSPLGGSKPGAAATPPQRSRCVNGGSVEGIVTMALNFIL